MPLAFETNSFLAGFTAGVLAAIVMIVVLLFTRFGGPRC